MGETNPPADPYPLNAFDPGGWAPGLASALAFLAGAATLISAANPSFHKAAVDAISLIAIEAPPLFAALVGVAQMAIADGLRRRVDGSMWAATSLSVLAAAYFIFHHERYLDAGFQLAFATFLLWNRRAFYRRARAFTIKLPPVWFAGAAAVVAVAMIAAVLWAGMRPGFRAAPWWSLLVDPVIGRAGRPVAIAGLALSGLAVWRYLATARPARRGPPAAEDYARAEAALDAAVDPRPESQLCFTGDVAFLFSPTDKSFLGYAVAGASLVALAAPVGQPEERRALLSAFCDLAARENLKPVIYAAPASLLPDLLDLGFKVEKIGENAVIDLENFSLAGKARESVRYANRRLTQRLGAHFQVHEPPHPPALYDRLRPVSDAWLAFHKSGEKRFSLGRFDPAILDRCRIGEVDWHGATIAFGSLLTTPDRQWAAVDLMRYAPADAPPGTVDFLLSELIFWTKESGYKRFDLSMAPLSGLADERHAPLFAKLGRLIYEQGGRWYNFEGLRRFKEKFAPEWEPRYLAARGAFSLPVALAEIAMLTNSPTKAAPMTGAGGPGRFHSPRS